MPFKSSRQRKWMWANKPKMARKWANEGKRNKRGRKRKKRR